MFRVLSAPDDTIAPAPGTPPPAPTGGNPLTGATETTLPGLATFKGLACRFRGYSGLTGVDHDERCSCLGR